jgi:hypothetical protein
MATTVRFAAAAGRISHPWGIQPRQGTPAAQTRLERLDKDACGASLFLADARLCGCKTMPGPRGDGGSGVADKAARPGPWFAAFFSFSSNA